MCPKHTHFSALSEHLRVQFFSPKFSSCWLDLNLSDVEKLFGNCTFKKTYFDTEEHTWQSCFPHRNVTFSTQMRGMRRIATKPPYQVHVCYVSCCLLYRFLLCVFLCPPLCTRTPEDWKTQNYLAQEVEAGIYVAPKLLPNSSAYIKGPIHNNCLCDLSGPSGFGGGVLVLLLKQCTLYSQFTWSKATQSFSPSTMPKRSQRCMNCMN